MEKPVNFKNCPRKACKEAYHIKLLNDIHHMTIFLLFPKAVQQFALEMGSPAMEYID